MQGLIDILKNDPTLEFVYFNEQGGWLLDKSNYHPIVKTREEVLAMEVEVEESEDEEVKLENALAEYKILEEENKLLAERVGVLEEEVVELSKSHGEKDTALTVLEKKSAEQKAEFEKQFAALNAQIEKLKKKEVKDATA